MFVLADQHPNLLATKNDISTTRAYTEQTPSQSIMSFQIMLKLRQVIGRAVSIKRRMCLCYAKLDTIKQPKFNITPLFVTFT